MSFDLFERLLKAEHEDEVERILENSGYGIANESAWRPLGDVENNFSTVGNQQTEPTGAMVEKLINAIDAVLMAECFNRGIDPEGSAAPPGMTEAVEQFFGVRDGRLENLLPKQQTDLADRIHLVAVGEKADPCYLVIDQGEGQTPNAFPDTLCSLKKSNKLRIPFVQGKFNSGGTGVLQFCGKKNMQLIVSKRRPNAPVSAEDDSRNLWGFTVVRRMRPSAGRRSSMYVYLAPGGMVPRFNAASINVLPDKRSSIAPRPYQEGLEHGTCIKLYNFRWKARSIATTETRYELERFLHLPCLPFRLTETRDYKANYFSTTISGVWVSVASANPDDENAKVEKGFPAYGEMTLRDIGKLPYRMVVFKEEVNPRRAPHGVFFTINGQVHGSLPSDFIARHLKFDYLKDHLLVSVDCTAMDSTVREDFFMASRDRVRRNEAYDAIWEALKDELREHSGLRELNARRRQLQIEKAVADQSETANVFNDLLKSDPSLAALFSAGDRLATSTGPGPEAPFQGRQFPTFFRIANAPKGGVVKRVPVNRTTRVVFETDAANDYFDRADSHGQIVTEPSGLIERKHLWNGEFTAHFSVPWDARPGQQVKVKINVSDSKTDINGQPFFSEFTMIIEGEASDSQPGSGGKQPSSKKPTPNGRQNLPRLQIPLVFEEHRPDEPYSSLRISHNEEQGLDFFMNVDNAFFLTELKRAKEEDRPLVKYWFNYGLTLCALGMIQELRRRQEAAKKSGEDNGAEGEDLGQIMGFCNGLARVIVPVIRALYRGPTLASP
jgi:hypothetical protein